MRLLLGLLAGAILTYTATAYGRGSAHEAASVPVTCSTYQGGVGFECTYPDPPRVQTAYSLRVPGLDLKCDLRGPGGGLHEGLMCRRASRPPGNECRGGRFGSLSVYITAASVAVTTPSRCAAASNALGFTITKPARLTRFARKP